MKSINLNLETKPLIILTGPTAAGKTDLSIKLAKLINGEIISADSAQVYKELNIGSAKITEEEMQGVPHHLIDMFEPTFPFDVTVFQREAKRIVDEIYSRGHVPIVVGGTGFYIQALIYDIDFNNEDTNSSTNSLRDFQEDINKRIGIESTDFRESLEKYIEVTKDTMYLHEELKVIDPKSAEIIHENNYRKVIRALEYYHYHGEQISKHNEAERKKTSIYNSKYFVLTMNRDTLYERINRRVDIMRNMGLLEEVKSLREKGYGPELTSMQAIGYKEIYAALSKIEKDGIKKDSKEYNEIINEAFEEIKLNTRHFAKRQLTWFRRERDVIWLDKDDHSEEEILNLILNTIV